MTNNDMPRGEASPDGHEPASPPLPHKRVIVAQVSLQVPSPRTAFPRDPSTAGSHALSYAILSGCAPQDPNALWVLVALAVAQLARATWSQHGR